MKVEKVRSSHARSTLHARYSLTTDNALRIDMMASATRKTPVNLTSHPYFNLAGHETGIRGLFEHEVRINSSSYLVSSPELVPTGDTRRAEGVLDLRIPQVLLPARPRFFPPSLSAPRTQSSFATYL
ncbi:hypothetical protein PR048_008086 [Dryococelus australis]|uniref:Galactose mutarotase n=1 Tax=Dryococelus australis TaxID=614101 RepID=A0ABQ9HWX5_9NEOP|nr:hypothetical protein PR048_008086 [Dryococelus australis]